MPKNATTFEKGKKPGPGRPKGRLNNKTLEVLAFSRELLNSEDYRQNLRTRLLAGTLAPALETMLYHYAYGKPPEKVELTGAESGPLQVVFGGRFRPDA